MRRARSGAATDRRAGEIAWLNMVGSICFGFAAIASVTVPASGEALNIEASTWCTLVGAICFLVGAYLLVPRDPEPSRS